MKIIIDSNIVFSALLSQDNRFKSFIHSEKYVFYTCNFLFTEMFKHKEKLIEISKLSEDEILNELGNIVTRIHFINENTIPKEIFNFAHDLCKNIDQKDTPFVALSIFLNVPLITGDKKLISGLLKKNYNNIKSLSDIEDFK